MFPIALRAALAVLALAVAGAGDSVARQAAASASAAPLCSHTWPGQETAIEAHLTAAGITRMEALPTGITKPRRGSFAGGGPVERFAWKALPPQRRRGFSESYKAEIAAYRLDQLLGMKMVPPAVERTIEGEVGAAILWIEDAIAWDKDRPAQGPEPAWSRQVSRMKLFDQLIGNIDRNQGNLLYDRDWHLFLIDHSRAFTTRTSSDGIAPINTVDRELWQKMDALTAADLDGALGAWLSDAERRAVLARRDRMRRAIEKLVREHGADRVFLG